jgi:hypothetical protein
MATIFLLYSFLFHAGREGFDHKTEQITDISVVVGVVIVVMVVMSIVLVMVVAIE